MQNKEINQNMSQNIGSKVRIVHNYIDKYFHSSWEKAGIKKWVLPLVGPISSKALQPLILS